MPVKRIIKKIIPTKIKEIAKKQLYKRFGFLNVTRPYEIKLLEKGRFKDKVVVVTGGSGAIGRAICCRLASEGAIVCVGGTTETRINSVVEEIKQLGGTSYPYIINVKDSKSIEFAFDSVIEAHGKIDVLVTSAGGSSRDKHSSIHEQDIDVIQDVIDLNLMGSILCTRQAGQHMVGRESGRIVMLSSTIGIGGKAGFSEYTAAKAGIIAYTKSLAMELGKFGINVNCVTPGIVQRDTISAPQLDYISKTNYLNSYGKPEDISNMVAYVASDEASFVTGQNFVVDGGRSLGLKGD